MVREALPAERLGVPAVAGQVEHAHERRRGGDDERRATRSRLEIEGAPGSLARRLQLACREVGGRERLEGPSAEEGISLDGLHRSTADGGGVWPVRERRDEGARREQRPGRCVARAGGLAVVAGSRRILDTADEEARDRPEVDQLGARGDPVTRHRVQPREQRRELARLVRPAGLPLQQADRPLGRSGRHRLGDRLLEQAVRLQVVGRTLPQRDLLLGIEQRAQVVGEQVVEAVPLALQVEWDEEQVHPLGALEQGGTVLAPGQLPAQPGREPLGDRDPHEERPELGIQPPEHLGGQVVEDEPLGAGEGVDDVEGRGLVTQRDRRKLESCDPSLRAFDESSEVLVVEIEPGPVSEIGRRLVGREPEIVRTQLDQAPMGAQSRQRERGVLAGDDDEMDERRPLFDQRAEQGVHGSRPDHVVVVEDEHERVVRRRHRRRSGGRRSRGRQRPRAARWPRRRSPVERAAGRRPCSGGSAPGRCPRRRARATHTERRAT